MINQLENKARLTPLGKTWTGHATAAEALFRGGV